MSTTPERLCIFCRRLEPTSSPCPKLLSGYKPSGISNTGPSLVAALPASDEALLASLQKKPSRLCQRCLEYDIVRVFRDFRPLDNRDETRLAQNDHERYREYRTQLNEYQMPFGKLSDLVLSPSCQLFRLVYRIFPREGLAPDDIMAMLSPFLSYIQEPGWQDLLSEGRSNGAISLGIDFFTVASKTGMGLFPTDEDFQGGDRTGEAIALISNQAYPSRTKLNACLVAPKVDFNMVKQRLDYCLKNHGSRCEGTFAKEVLTAKMIDVERRSVVSCPPDCKYLALSYVWGGVNPVPGALEAHELPPTIEDAITVTKELGMKYLWVDALCIDQNPSTPEQAAAKQKQLMIMDLIYASAFMTLVALSGSSSNSGLMGVSPESPRPRQFQEIIDGHTFLTTPPAHAAEHAHALWRSRAWTLQEIVFSTRSLYFNANQFIFNCYTGNIPEALDLQTIIPRAVRGGDTFSILSKSTKPGQSRQDLDEASGGMAMGYTTLVQEYIRRDMTKDEDSLNAFLGVLSAFERCVLPSGFIFGLPLEKFPETIGWIHDHAITPRRRLGFPTWSWAGWAGSIQIPAMLLNPREERRRLNVRTDLKPRLVSITGQSLAVEGHVMQIDILTEPFSEVLHPSTREPIGSIREGNCPHNTTIPTGYYSALVVERVRYLLGKDGPEKQRVFLMLLDWKGQVAERRTVVTFAPFSKHDVQDLKLDKRVVTLI